MAIREKGKRTKLFWAIFIILIMISSSAAFVYNFFVNNDNDATKKTKYNGYTFTRAENGGWQTTYAGQQIIFSYLPNDLEDTDIETINLNFQKVYLGYNASNYSESELFNLQRLRSALALNNRVGVLACISEEKCPDIPIVDCNGSYPAIYYKLSDNNNTNNLNDKVKIEKSGNCYSISSNTVGFDMFTEKFIFKLYGII